MAVWVSGIPVATIDVDAVSKVPVSTIFRVKFKLSNDINGVVSDSKAPIELFVVVNASVCTVTVANSTLNVVIIRVIGVGDISKFSVDCNSDFEVSELSLAIVVIVGVSIFAVAVVVRT